MIKRLAALAAALAGAAYVAVAIVGADRITRRPRQPVLLAPESIGAVWEAVAFGAAGLAGDLRGWWFPAANARRALILVHGRGQNRYDRGWQSDAIARAFLGRGYSVLLFDLRGHGESAAARLSYGLRERDDVLGAVAYVRERGFADTQLAIIGDSYGAAALLMALTALPPAVALVADSAYAALWPLIAQEMPKDSPLLARLRPGPGIRAAARLLFRTDLHAARPIDAVRHTPDRPVLFIHGAADTYVPPQNSVSLRAASASPASDLWLVSGAEHSLTYATAPEEWIARVTRFLDDRLRDASPA